MFKSTCRKLPPETCAQLDALLLPARGEDAGPAEAVPLSTPFAILKTDPGPLGLASMPTEIEKLRRIEELLTLRSNNTAQQPVINALAWLKASRDSRKQYVSCDEIPIDGVVRSSMQDLLIEAGPNGGGRINRINYETGVLQALQERLRCKEIWVEGADRYRNPDDDLPADFPDKGYSGSRCLLPETASTASGVGRGVAARQPA